MSDLSYTLFRNGELLDLECDTPEAAIEWMEEEYADECADHGWPQASEDIFIITRQVTDEGWQEIDRKPYTLYYAVGRSDRDEHFNEGDYL